MKYFTPVAVLVGPALVEVVVLELLLLLDFFVVVDKVVVVTDGAVVVVLAVVDLPVVDVAVQGTHWTGGQYQMPSCHMQGEISPLQ